MKAKRIIFFWLFITDEIPFDIPNNWEWCRVDFLFSCYQPKTIATNALISDGKYLVYGANGVIGRYNEYNHSESEILLTCRGATCGNVNVSEPFSWINGNAMVIHPYPTKIDRCYIVYMLKILGKSSDLITGTAQPQIVQNNLNKLLVPLPPLSEQKRIVSEIEKIFKQIEVVQENQEELSKLKDGLKNKILDLAIQGKLVEQDPNDEPASELLKKIKAEKAELVKQGKIKKDKQESYIFKGDDNRHYEQIGSEVRDITEEIPFEIPNSWEWVRLGSIMEIARGGSPRPIQDYLTTDDNGLNWIKIGDTDKGGKYIARYSLDLLTTEQKLNFLADFYTSVANNEFDNEIIEFLAQEVDNAAVRKKEANERRRLKKKAQKEQKAKEDATKQAEATARTIAAAEPMLQELGIVTGAVA